MTCRKTLAENKLLNFMGRETFEILYVYVYMDDMSYTS